MTLVIRGDALFLEKMQKELQSLATYIALKNRKDFGGEKLWGQKITAYFVLRQKAEGAITENSQYLVHSAEDCLCKTVVICWEWFWVGSRFMNDWLALHASFSTTLYARAELDDAAVTLIPVCSFDPMAMLTYDQTDIHSNDVRSMLSHRILSFD